MRARGLCFLGRNARNGLLWGELARSFDPAVGDKSKNKSPEQQLACPFCFLCVGLLIKTLKVICPRRGEGTSIHTCARRSLPPTSSCWMLSALPRWRRHYFCYRVTIGGARLRLPGRVSLRRAFFYFMAPATNFNGPLFGSSPRDQRKSQRGKSSCPGRNKLPCASQSFFTLSSNLNLGSRMGGARAPPPRPKRTPSEQPPTAFVFLYIKCAEPPRRLTIMLTTARDKTKHNNSIFSSLNQ